MILTHGMLMNIGGINERLVNVIVMNEPSTIEIGELYFLSNPMHPGRGIIIANKQLPAVDSDRYERRKVVCWF